MHKPILRRERSSLRVFMFGVAASALLSASFASAAAPGIKGPNFSLTAQDNYITQPDGQAIYSWGYGCTTGVTPTCRTTLALACRYPDPP